MHLSLIENWNGQHNLGNTVDTTIDDQFLGRLGSYWVETTPPDNYLVNNPLDLNLEFNQPDNVRTVLGKTFSSGPKIDTGIYT